MMRSRKVDPDFREFYWRPFESSKAGAGSCWTLWPNFEVFVMFFPFSWMMASKWLTFSISCLVFVLNSFSCTYCSRSALWSLILLASV